MLFLQVRRGTLWTALASLTAHLWCEKRHFLRHLYIQTIILPRQARDKHRESTQKTTSVLLQVDTARHWLSMAVLERLLDGMASTKLNVLHWHISDSESIPYHTKKYPKLWEGAWSRDEKYSLGVRETRF
jgi:hypothetical protein|eukprot:COSAG06_NODE_172_length_21346_cov_503.127053_3_plen_130_part_00